MADKIELLDRLKKLNESQLDELILRLDVDRAHLRGGGASLSQKASDLIHYLEQQVDGLQRLRGSLEKLLPSYELEDPASLADCPYQGLSAFQEEKWADFFGRDAFIEDWVQDDGSVRQGLVRAVETKPLVAVVGASGSGKSSLVFAGLLPRLRKTGDWLIESFRPEKQPLFQLAVALMQQLDPALDRVGRIARANDLAKIIKEHGVASVVSEILQGHSGQRLLLVVDQFEELYTQCEVGERDRFIDVLLEGLNKAMGLKVVLTLRADFCGQVYAYRPLADALQGADLKLGPMNPEELLEAIERPAGRKGVEFETGLTELLLDDVGQEVGNLPLLEFALTELWKRQSQKTLTSQAYVELGGVARALANHANAVYAKLSDADQQRAQRIFVQLVRPGDGTEDTRRVATRAEVGADNWDLVTQLAGERERLVVTGRNEDTVELVHEALLREWQQLQEWMKQDRTFRVWQEGLRFARRQWQQSGEDEKALLDGFLLREAEEWQSKRQETLSAEEHKFILNSQKVRDRKEAEKNREEAEKNRVQLELEGEKKQREAVEQANIILAKAQTKAKRVVRFGFLTMGLSIGLAVIFIVAIPLSSVFFNNRGYAKFIAGDDRGALQDFDIALSFSPGNAASFYNKGLVYDKLGDLDLAFVNYRAAQSQKFMLAYGNLARLQIIKNEDYGEAIRLIEEAMDLGPDKQTQYSLLKNLGWAKLKLKQYDQAEKQLISAITIDGKRGSAHCLLAQAMAQQSKYSDSINYWKRCLMYSNDEHPDEREWKEEANSILEKQKVSF